MTQQCTDVAGTGQSPFWNDFYSARKDQKVNVLATAIKGIGHKMATRLVEGNYFQSKPRSWNAFVSTIQQAGSDIESATCQGNKAGCIQANSWVPNVTQNFAKDNQFLLGYDTKRICQDVPVIETKTGQEPLPQANRVAKITSWIRGLALLPGECETFQFNYDGNEQRQALESHSSNFNTIAEVSGMPNTFNFQGQGRKQVGPAGNLISGATLSGNSVIFSLGRNSLAYSQNSAFSAQCKLEGTVTVNGVTGWGWNKKTEALATKAVTIENNAASTAVDMGSINLNKDQKADIKFSLHYAPVLLMNTSYEFRKIDLKLGQKRWPFLDPKPFWGRQDREKTDINIRKIYTGYLAVLWGIHREEMAVSYSVFSGRLTRDPYHFMQAALLE